MAGAATDLYDLCGEYLQACIDALAGAPGGPIDRAFVSPGPPAWDCPEQLTVHAGGPVIGDTMPLSPPLQTGHRIEETGTLNLVTMTATVLRCSPSVSGRGMPSPVELDAAAQNTLGDVWAIWNFLVSRKRSEALWGPKTRELILDPAVVLNPAGGTAGWQLQIRVHLGGYTP